MKNYLFVLFGLLVLHLFLLINLQFTAWPEMLSYPYLVNNGFKLYSDFIHPYPPFLTLFLSVIYRLFGYQLLVLKLVTWLVILLNDILIYKIVQRLTGGILYSVFSILFYVLTQPFLEGNQLWFDLAIVPPILLFTYYFLQKDGKRNLFLAGLFLGIACLIKQTVGIFLVTGSLYLVVRKVKVGVRVRNLLLFLTGPIILFLILILRLFTDGSLANFVNWTLIYPSTFWTKFPGYVQMNLSSYQLLLLLVLLVPFVFFLTKLKDLFFKDYNLSLVAFCLLLSFILVYPRFSFFHFQLALAFLAILVGILLSKVNLRPFVLIAYSLLLVAFIVFPKVQSNWGQETRFYGKAELELAKIVEENTQPDDRIYLLGPHSGLYVLSSRLPPRPWTDNFGWYLEIQGVQDKILAAWANNPPRAIFWQVPTDGNWFDLGAYQPQKITKWIENNYTREVEVKPGIWLWRPKSLRNTDVF